ncbi:MAG: hypothetical protein F6K17_36735 [Okeania sp. SIO3C4]|nr:hypothetical protein [Okeania sp. SIO3C4]
MRIINMVEFCHKQMLKNLSKGLPKSISILIITLIFSISGNSAYSQGTKDKINDNYQQKNDLKLLSVFPENKNFATHPINSLLAQNQKQR